MNSFVEKENVSSQQNNIKIIWRFLRELDLLNKMMPLSMAVIIASAAITPLYLWYLGQYINCQYGNQCNTSGWLESYVLNGLLTLAISGIILRILSWGLFELPGQWSTQSLHKNMMAGISKVRTTYFDENPSGRLLNKLLGDFSMLRLDGVCNLGDTASCLIELVFISILAVIAHPIAGLMVIPLVIAAILFQAQLGPMLSHGRELRSIYLGEALHRETDLIEGRRTFVLYNKQGALLNRLHKSLQKVLDIQVFNARLFGWGMFWMGLISTAYTSAVYLVIVWSIELGHLNSVDAGVIMTALFSMYSLFIFLSWELSFLGESAAHARRVYGVVDLPPEQNEEAKTSGEAELPAHLYAGEIVFTDFIMSYRKTSEPILKGLNLRLEKGKKYGVVGRTGAGKSSLVQSLYRMVYKHQGDISIGGCSIYQVAPNVVRDLFGMVPQDPYLFAGSLRFNLTGSNSQDRDPELREALTAVDLIKDLDLVVAEGGRDLSVGERQLLCLARVLLSGKPFLIMDEPTSAMDNVTDAKMQKLLHRNFADKTVITIAHRLDSLQLYDQIIEIRDGKLFRQASPAVLLPILQQEGSA